jgi:hypothetical protein
VRLFEFVLCYVARVGLMTGQQGVNKALYQLAARSVVDSQYELAIRCLLAVLENSPDPDEFVQCSLDLARLYIEYTDDCHKAQEKLLQLVRFVMTVDSAWCLLSRPGFSGDTPSFAACPHQGSRAPV